MIKVSLIELHNKKI